MSTHNICFCGEIRKISAFFGRKKCHAGNEGPAQAVHLQSDHGLQCPLTGSMDTVKYLGPVVQS